MLCERGFAPLFVGHVFPVTKRTDGLDDTTTILKIFLLVIQEGFVIMSLAGFIQDFIDHRRKDPIIIILIKVRFI